MNEWNRMCPIRSRLHSCRNKKSFYKFIALVTSKERSERIGWSAVEQHTCTDRHLSWSSCMSPCGQRSIGLPWKSVHWLQVRGGHQPFLHSALLVRFSAGRTRTAPICDVRSQTKYCRKITIYTLFTSFLRDSCMRVYAIRQTEIYIFTSILTVYKFLYLFLLNNFIIFVSSCM